VNNTNLFAETYNFEQAVIGTIIGTSSSSVLSDTYLDVKKLLLGRKADITALVLLRISLTDDISVDQIYTSRAPELSSGCAIKLG
jgi:hypothetical protein